MSDTKQAPTRIVLPLFPLPDVVLFPGVELPLHVFEPRYRQLTEDALAADRRLGMAVLEPGHEPGAPGNPPIHPLVGFGVIEAARRFADGRFLLLVRGVGKGIVTGGDADGREALPACPAPGGA
jgi:Lon protease-like protein